MIIFEKTVNLADYHPSVVADSFEFKTLANSENPEFRLLWDEMQDAFNNQFIEDALTYGISQWEKILDLIPLDEDTIDDRRSAVIMALMGQLPYTYKKLEELLANLCGDDGYNIDLKPNDFSIKVLVSLGSKRQRTSVINLLEEIIPKNLIITVDLLYNRHKDIKRFTHGRMRDLPLTHHDLRKEVLPNG